MRIDCKICKRDLTKEAIKMLEGKIERVVCPCKDEELRDRIAVEFDLFNTTRQKHITVLDFEVGRVFQYKISDQRLTAWNPEEESCEDYLTSKGHNLTNCEWMVHETAQVITAEDYREVVMNSK
jgi:hypothetical protein